HEDDGKAERRGKDEILVLFVHGDRHLMSLNITGVQQSAGPKVKWNRVRLGAMYRGFGPSGMGFAEFRRGRLRVACGTGFDWAGAEGVWRPRREGRIICSR
ncbi:MAG: hypothetical protein ACU0BP_01495, partial [Sulfitobacter sp.]